MAELLGVAGATVTQILIPYANTERTDKLHNRLLIGRLDGHQNFATVSEDGLFLSERQAEAMHKSKRLMVEAEKIR